jgi:hypothetical protein
VHEQLLTLDGVLVWVDPISRGKDPHCARCHTARCRGARTLGQRAPRRDHEDGRQGSPAPNEVSWLGDRYVSLPFRSRFPRRVSVTAAIGRPARPKAEPR